VKPSRPGVGWRPRIIGWPTAKELHMKLFYSPAACSLSPHIVAREAGIEVELVKVDLKAHKTAQGVDFYSINPNGYVPALQLDDGTTLTEGPAIVQYLADQKPQSQLAPANGSIERYRLQQWLNFITSELHKTLGALFNPATTADQRGRALELVGKRLDYVTQSLQGPYLFGEPFTVADAYLFTVLNWHQFLKVDLGRWPRLQEYLARVAARPAVQRALQEEGLLKR
jgi:glutathione S-transferase